MLTAAILLPASGCYQSKDFFGKRYATRRQAAKAASCSASQFSPPTLPPDLIPISSIETPQTNFVKFFEFFPNYTVDFFVLEVIHKDQMAKRNEKSGWSSEELAVAVTSHGRFAHESHGCAGFPARRQA